MSKLGAMYNFDETFRADASMSKYSVVVYNTATRGYVSLPDASGATAIVGVIQEDALASGDIVSVRRHGVSKVIAKHTLTIGDLVYAGNTDGRVGKPTSWSNGDGMVGRAEESASASGDIIACFLQISEVR